MLLDPRTREQRDILLLGVQILFISRYLLHTLEVTFYKTFREIQMSDGFIEILLFSVQILFVSRFIYTSGPVK